MVLFFATSVIAAQFSRTNAKFLMPSSEALVNVLGEDFANAIVKVYARDGVAVGQSAMRYAAKVLRNQALTAGITVIILSASDVVDLFRGRISPEQLVKNLIVTSAGVSGGYIGWTAGSILGSSIVPGVGTYVGGVAGSVVGGGAASIISDKVLSAFIKDDADEMYEIIENEFETLCVDYMVNDEEADAITDELSDLLSTNKLKEMYASDDRENYAAIMMEPLFETQVSNRDEIEIPTEEEMRNELISDLDDVVYLH